VRVRAVGGGRGRGAWPTDCWVATRASSAERCAKRARCISPCIGLGFGVRVRIRVRIGVVVRIGVGARAGARVSWRQL